MFSKDEEMDVEILRHANRIKYLILEEYLFKKMADSSHFVIKALSLQFRFTPLLSLKMCNCIINAI